MIMMLQDNDAKDESGKCVKLRIVSDKLKGADKSMPQGAFNFSKYPKKGEN